MGFLQLFAALFAALLAATIFGLCSGQQACSSTDLEEKHFNFSYINPTSIKLDHTGIIAEFSMINTKSVQIVGTSPYILAKYDAVEKKLQFLAAAQLANYDQTETKTSIPVKVLLGCTVGTRELIFEQPLSEENNHTPQFSQTVYEFVVMLPLPRGFDLTFFQKVSARDLDIHKNQVTFTSGDAVGVTVGTMQLDEGTTDGKTFFATLLTSHQLLSVGEKLEFTITATDAGNPPRSSSAQVILRPNEEDVFIPVPVFASSFYRGHLNEERELILDPLQITEETYGKDIVVQLSGTDSALFDYQSAENIITMRLARALTDADILNKNILIATVEATREDAEPGSTVVIVDVTQPVVTVPEALPEFEKLLYVGELDENRALILDNVVLKSDTFSEEIQFALTEADHSLFSFEQSANVVTVKLAGSLNDEDVEAKTFLTTVLKASRPNVGVGTTTIVVRVPGKSEVVDPDVPVPRFESTFYMGEIQRADGTLSVAVSPSLIESTYQEDVVFELTGDDADLFTVKNQQRVVSVELRRQLTDAEKLKTLFLVTIVAKNTAGSSGSTEFIVTQEQPQVVIGSQPVFEQRVYVGKIGVDGQLQATFPAITLTTASITDGIEYELIEDESQVLQITTLNNVATLTLSRALTEDELRQKTYLKALLIATNAQSTTGTAVIVIDITPPATIPPPQFVQDIYHGSLDSNLALTFQDVLIVADTFTEDVTLQLLSDDYALFTATKSTDGIAIALAAPLTEADVADRTYLTTVLRATRPNVGQTSVVLLVKLALTTPQPAIPQPQFVQPVYRGSIDEDLQLIDMDAIALVESSYTTGVKFTLTGDDYALFTFHTTAHTLQITLLPGELTAATLEGKQYLSFRVNAEHPETATASAGVLIDIPAKVCTWDETPMFEQLVYAIPVPAPSKGLLGRVRARVPGKEDRALRYSFETIAAELVDRLAIDENTGELSLIDNLNVGKYVVGVAALDTSTMLKGSAEVHLTVSDGDDCPTETVDHHVDNSVLVKYLIENKEHLNIMPSTIGDACTFAVVQSNPSDVVYVRIDAATKQLTSVQLDREADIFEPMAVPQIQVTLQLNCDDDVIEQSRFDQRQFSDDSDNATVMAQRSSVPKSRSLDPMASDGRWYTLIADALPFAPRITHLTIIIEDENDNAPQFVTPLLDNLLFGYPDALLAEQIMPPQLLRVYAIDRDAGLNAVVRYTLEANAHFQIDGVTGRVTPLQSALALTADDELELVVRATDRDGAADGLQSDRSVLVRRLLAEHITVISVLGQGLDDVERMVDQVYTATGLELKILHSARISVHDDATGTTTTKQQQDQSNVLRMFAYAVKTDSTVGFMQSTDVQRILRTFDTSLYRLSAVSMAEHLAVVGPTSVNTDQVALVVLCSVLGVLLLLTGVGTFVMWWYKIRPYEYRQMEDGDSVASGREPVMGRMEPSAVVVQPPGSMATKGGFGFEGKTSDAPRGVLTLNGSTTQETGDDVSQSQSQLASSFLERLNRQLSTGPRKNTAPTAPSPPESVGVRFNEMVERIDIEIEPEADAAGKDSHRA